MWTRLLLANGNLEAPYQDAVNNSRTDSKCAIPGQTTNCGSWLGNEADMLSDEALFFPQYYGCVFIDIKVVICFRKCLSTTLMWPDEIEAMITTCSERLNTNIYIYLSDTCWPTSLLPIWRVDPDRIWLISLEVFSHLFLIEFWRDQLEIWPNGLWVVR